MKLPKWIRKLFFRTLCNCSEYGEGVPYVLKEDGWHGVCPKCGTRYFSYKKENEK